MAVAVAIGVVIFAGGAVLLLHWLGSGPAPPRRLVTNEFAHFNTTDSRAVKSPKWEVTSGSLFRWGDVYGGGKPDDRSPDHASKNGTGSAVFRAVQPESVRDATVTFSLRDDGLASTARTPEVAFDGFHVFLRYQSPEALYAVSVNRRDNTVAVKRKLPGGRSNGGRYATLAQTYSPVTYKKWVDYKVQIRTVAHHDVRIDLEVDGKAVLSALDHGQAGHPILAPGRVGVRADNCWFFFKNFEVKSGPNGELASAPHRP